MSTLADPDDARRLAEPAWPNRGYAWYVVFMLMLAYAFSIVDRTGLGLLVQPIEADLGISDGRMGLLQGAAFAIFYGVLGLPIGFLADRVNRRTLIAAGITVWSAATVMCGLSSGFWGLFGARIGVGAGEATLGPAGISMMADYFPPASRSKAFGVYAIGTALGIGAALLLGGGAIAFAETLRKIGPAWLATIASWKIVFFLIGAPGIVVGVIFALTVREPVRRGRSGLPPTLSLKPLLALLAARKAVYGGLLSWTVLNSVAIYALVGWFPTVMVRAHGWTPAQTGQILGAVVLPFGIFSCLSGGWSISWLEKWGRADAPILIAVAASVWVTIAGIVANLASSAEVAVVAYCLLSLAVNNGGIALLTSLNQITPNEMRGQVVALSGMMTGLVSVTVGPAAVGYLSQNVFPQPEGIGEGIATVEAVTGTAGIVILLLIRTHVSRAIKEQLSLGA
jgi:MFS family permease